MDETKPRIYTFGPFEIDLEQRLLLRAGESVPLTPKAFDTLGVLVARPGKIVDKAELLKLVWPDTFVEENTTTGPAMLVTAAMPARPGEVLTLFASGLGPTRPGVDPGQVFTASPAQVASSPIDVLVNGKAGDLLYAGGYPNTVDGYQVNFRIPDDTAPGIAAIQLTGAWIAGTEVRIPVQ